jgi:hypothetical protein
MTPNRPKFTDITQHLDLPDDQLLKWTEEDKSTHPGADKLGANFLCTQDLYEDLQMVYEQNTASL